MCHQSEYTEHKEKGNNHHAYFPIYFGLAACMKIQFGRGVDACLFQRKSFFHQKDHCNQKPPIPAPSRRTQEMTNRIKETAKITDQIVFSLMFSPFSGACSEMSRSYYELRSQAKKRPAVFHRLFPTHIPQRERTGIPRRLPAGPRFFHRRRRGADPHINPQKSTSGDPLRTR